MFGWKEMKRKDVEENAGMAFPKSGYRPKEWQREMEGGELEGNFPLDFVHNKSFQYWKILKGKHINLHSPSLPFVSKILSFTL